MPSLVGAGWGSCVRSDLSKKRALAAASWLFPVVPMERWCEDYGGVFFLQYLTMKKGRTKTK